MDSNIVWRVVGLILAAVAAGAGVYVCYRYFDRLKSLLDAKAAGRNYFVKGDNAERLSRECWDTYIQLQTIVASKEAYHKCLFGDTGIATALNQLKTILASGRDDAYMVPRIADQVCGFIANTLVVGHMISADGAVRLPQSKPSLMERDIYFRNIVVSPAEQTEKYRKVAEYQRSRIASECADTRFADMLGALLPWLGQAYDIAEGKTVLSPQQTVKWGKDFIDNSSKIIEKYGK